MSKDQVRRAIHVKRFSSAHKWDFPRCQAKTTKALLWFLSLTLRFRDKELELLAVLANTSFFSFLFFCLSGETRIIVLNPRRCPADLFSHVDYCSICYTGPLYCHILFNLYYFFIYSGLRNRKEKERLGGELTEGEGQKNRAEEDLERKDRKSAEKTSKMKTTQQGNHSNNQPQH